MSTQRYLVGELSRKGSRNQDSQARWDFSIHFTLNAGIHSVFYALTLPEYIEAWMRAPGFPSATATQEGADYCLQFHSDEQAPVVVRGSWLQHDPSRLRMTWNRGDGSMHLASAVSVDLQPSAGRTLLHLYHRGFTTAEQSLWHGELWSSSIHALANLLSVGGDGCEARVYAVSSLHRSELLHGGAASARGARVESRPPLRPRRLAAR